MKRVITAIVIILMFYIVIAFVFPTIIPFLIIGFVISLLVMLFLAFDKTPKRVVLCKNEIDEVDITDIKTEKPKTEDYPDEFDHPLEDHDTFEGWCEDCEEHEDDLNS